MQQKLTTGSSKTLHVISQDEMVEHEKEVYVNSLNIQTQEKNIDSITSWRTYFMNYLFILIFR